MDGAVICLSFAVNICNFDIIIIMLNLSVFCYVQNEMLCTKHIMVISLGNRFPMVLSGEVYENSSPRRRQ